MLTPSLLPLAWGPWRGASPSPEGHLISSTVMDTPACHASGTNHTLSSTTDHRGSWGSQPGSVTVGLGQFTLTLTRVGSLHVTSVHRTSLAPTHVTALEKHTPPSWAQPLCSAEQLLPQGIEVRQLLTVSGEQTGRRKWWGALEGLGNILRSKFRSPCHEFPGSGPLAQMLTDGSMLTLPQLSASLDCR